MRIKIGMTTIAMTMRVANDKVLDCQSHLTANKKFPFDLHAVIEGN